MKYTGIIRRLDALGRVVLPREYRKTLKINEGDPLEIIATDEGDIVVRKVDISAMLESAAEAAVSELKLETGGDVLLSDKLKFLSGGGESATSLAGERLDPKTAQLILQRKTFNGKAREIGLDMAEFAALAPIYKEDLFGALIIVSNSEISEADERVLKITAKIIGSQMQKY